MKFFRKEILIIAILALLATVLSSVMIRNIDEPCLACEQNPLCDPAYPCITYGFPFPYRYASWDSDFSPFSIGNNYFFILDFLFYLVIFWFGWKITKLIATKIKR